MARPKQEKVSYYTVAEAAALMDAPTWTVERSVKAGLIPGALFVREAQEWRIPERGLSLFLQRRVEPMYSAEMVAGLLGVTEDTAREYLKRMQTVKLGTAKSAPVRVPESELRRFINA